jgi:hypothetical protein
VKYMVIETFKEGMRAKVYERFGRDGRMLPEGLHFLQRWLEQDGNRCFQLMETSDPKTFQVWTARWEDLVDFEIILLEEK